MIEQMLGLARNWIKWLLKFNVGFPYSFRLALRDPVLFSQPMTSPYLINTTFFFRFSSFFPNKTKTG